MEAVHKGRQPRKPTRGTAGIPLEIGHSPKGGVVCGSLAQGVNRDPLAESQLLDHALHRAVDAGACHRFGRRVGLGVVPPRGREQPGRVAVRDPVLAEHGQSPGRERHKAVLGALATMDMDDHPPAVDVADLQIQTLLEPQPQRVDGPEEGLVVGRAHGVDQAPDLGDAQDVRQAPGPGDAEALEGEPVAWDGIGVEEDEAAGGDLQRAGRIRPLLLEVDEVLPQFVFGDPVGRLVEVSGEMTDGAEVSFLGPLGEAGQLEVLVHALAKREAHEWVLSKRREEKPSGNPLCLGHRRVSPGPRRPPMKVRPRAVSSARQPRDHPAAQPRCPTKARGRKPSPEEGPEIILPRSGLLEQLTKPDLAQEARERRIISKCETFR